VLVKQWHDIFMTYFAFRTVASDIVHHNLFSAISNWDELNGLIGQGRVDYWAIHVCMLRVQGLNEWLGSNGESRDWRSWMRHAFVQAGEDYPYYIKDHLCSGRGYSEQLSCVAWQVYRTDLSASEIATHTPLIKFHGGMMGALNLGSDERFLSIFGSPPSLIAQLMRPPTYEPPSPGPPPLPLTPSPAPSAPLSLPSTLHQPPSPVTPLPSLPAGCTDSLACIDLDNRSALPPPSWPSRSPLLPLPPPSPSWPPHSPQPPHFPQQTTAHQLDTATALPQRAKCLDAPAPTGGSSVGHLLLGVCLGFALGLICSRLISLQRVKHGGNGSQAAAADMPVDGREVELGHTRARFSTKKAEQFRRLQDDTDTPSRGLESVTPTGFYY